MPCRSKERNRILEALREKILERDEEIQALIEAMGNLIVKLNGNSDCPQTKKDIVKLLFHIGKSKVFLSIEFNKIK